MKSILRLIFISLIAANSVIIYSCGPTNPGSSETLSDQTEMTVTVEGLDSENTVNSITKALTKLPGVKKVHASIADQQIKIVYNFSATDPNELAKVIRDTGLIIKKLDPQMIKEVLNVNGMTCESCASTIKKVLKSENGVVNVVISVKNKTVEVTYKPKLISKDQIVKAINDLGFKVVR